MPREQKDNNWKYATRFVCTFGHSIDKRLQETLFCSQAVGFRNKKEHVLTCISTCISHISIQVFFFWRSRLWFDLLHIHTYKVRKFIFLKSLTVECLFRAFVRTKLQISKHPRVCYSIVLAQTMRSRCGCRTCNVLKSLIVKYASWALDYKLQ